MDPLHATIEEFAAEGYTLIEANCPRCRVIRLRPIRQLLRISMGLTLDAMSHDYSEQAERKMCMARDSALAEQYKGYAADYNQLRLIQVSVIDQQETD